MPDTPIQNFPTIGEASLWELAQLQNELLQLTGSRRPPMVRNDNGEYDTSFKSMGYQEFLPPDNQLDPLSSHIMWSASFMPAQAREMRAEKGWATSITTGLAIVTDGLHQQLINFGRNSKALIDMKALEDELRGSISAIPVPFSAKNPPATKEGIEKLLGMMRDRPTVPLRLKLREGEDRQTFDFENTPGISASERDGDANLLTSLIGLNTLANGNVSRFEIKDGKYEYSPDKELLKVGAAEDAVKTLENVRAELGRQLQQMQDKGDKRLEGLDITEVVNRNFDLNRKAYERLVKSQVGFLKVASVVAQVVVGQGAVKTIDKVLALVGEKQVEIPEVENADQAKRLVMAAAYATARHYGEGWVPSKQWAQTQRRWNTDTKKLVEKLEAVAKENPDNPKAILADPETEKFLKLVDATAEQFNDKSLKRLLETVEPLRAVNREKLDETVRGPKKFIHKIYDGRRKSTLVDALDDGHSKEQIGEAGERAATRYEEGEGKPSFSQLLREELKDTPRER